MATNDLGVVVPSVGDAFDPQGDMTALAASLAGQITVLVANTTERDALAATLSPTTSTPLSVFRADAPAGRQYEYTTDGITWLPFVPGAVRYTSDAGFPVTTAGSSSETVGNRITIPSAPYARAVSVTGSVYLTSSQTAICEALLYAGGSRQSHDRREIAAGKSETFQVTGHVDVAAGSGVVLEVRHWRTTGSGTVTPSTSGDLSKMTALAVPA